MFAQKGFDAVTIRELSEEANTNCSLISYYFGGKKGLYATVLEKQFEPALETLSAISNTYHLSPRERLQLFAKTILSYQTKNPLFLQFLCNESTLPTSSGQFIVKQYLTQSLQIIHTILEEGVQSGDFKSNFNIDYAGLALYGIINFHANSLFAALPQHWDETLIPELIDLYLYGFAKNSE